MGPKAALQGVILEKEEGSPTGRHLLPVEPQNLFIDSQTSGRKQEAICSFEAALSQNVFHSKAWEKIEGGNMTIKQMESKQVQFKLDLRGLFRFLTVKFR